MRNYVMTIALCALLMGSASSQTKSSPAKTSGSTAPTTTVPAQSTTPGGDQLSLDERLANSVTDVTSDPDDHVKCFFTLKQLVDLRPIPAVAKLTEADESQVLTSVIAVLDQAPELAADQKSDLIEKFRTTIDGQLVGKTPGEALATVMSVLYSIQNATLKTNPYFAAAVTSEEKLSQQVAADTGNTVDLTKSTGWYKENDPISTLNNAYSLIEKTAPKGDSKAEEAKSQVASAHADAVAITQLSGVAADNARSELNKLSAPRDIYCAYQILSWKDARLMFGRSVANEFISVQVTIRNLNPKEEFIVHNAELAVDTDVNGPMGRYFEGVDKIGVEAYNNAGEALTARGIVGNSISAATTLLSALQPIVNVGNFSNAVAAFNGGVPKGWGALQPDHQKEQLLLIANNGFSASDSFKTVVPKSSAATFFTWFPAKPFLQGWWLQDCAQHLVGPSDQATIIQLGVDKGRARRGCEKLATLDAKMTPYQNWTSISDQLFRDLSMIVVAGIHVREESKNKASITDLKCPKDAQGQLDLSKPSSSGTISCDVTGENLDKISKLRLENASNLVDPGRPEGVISEVSADNSSAKVAFNVAELKAAPGDSYSVFAVGKDGTETATGQKIYLSKNTGADTTAPKIVKLDPTTLDLSKQHLGSITLSGTNLDKLKNVCLLAASGAKITASVSPNATSTTAILDLNSKGLTNGSWAVYTEECADSQKTGLTLTVTGPTPGKAPAGKPKGGLKASPKVSGAQPSATHS